VKIGQRNLACLALHWSLGERYGTPTNSILLNIKILNQPHLTQPNTSEGGIGSPFDRGEYSLFHPILAQSFRLDLRDGSTAFRASLRPPHAALRTQEVTVVRRVPGCSGYGYTRFEYR